MITTLNELDGIILEGRPYLALMNEFDELEVVEVYQDEVGIYPIWSTDKCRLEGKEETAAIKVILKAKKYFGSL